MPEPTPPRSALIADHRGQPKEWFRNESEPRQSHDCSGDESCAPRDNDGGRLLGEVGDDERSRPPGSETKPIMMLTITKTAKCTRSIPGAMALGIER
jgi:hypothetical protein